MKTERYPYRCGTCGASSEPVTRWDVEPPKGWVKKETGPLTWQPLCPQCQRPKKGNTMQVTIRLEPKHVKKLDSLVVKERKKGNDADRSKVLRSLIEGAR